MLEIDKKWSKFGYTERCTLDNIICEYLLKENKYLET